MPTYQFSQLKGEVNGRIKGKIGIMVNSRATINAGVRQVNTDFDLASTRRKSRLTPNLFSGPGEYACPNDLKMNSIVTIEPQVLLQQRQDWGLVPYEQFARRMDRNTIAIGNSDLIKKLYALTYINDLKQVVSSFDSLTAGGGTWLAVGDATNVRADQDNFVEGAGSIAFDLSSNPGLTAGVKDLGINTTDLTKYLQGNGTLIVFAYIVSTTGLTNYILQIGTDASNYYQKTVTSQQDGTAFRVGWNVLEFDLNSLTTVGTPTITTSNFASLYMTKLGTKINEVGYRFDYMVLRKGEINYVVYYSKYGWQTNAGVYIENSTVDTDYFNAESAEYDLILDKCTELCANEVDEDKVAKDNNASYKDKLKNYKMNSPSESLTMIITTADFVRV